MPGINVNEVIEFLENKWGKDKKCPMCNHQDWTVTPNAYELREFSGLNLMASETVVPVIPVICKNCGNTVLLNAVTTGFVKGSKEQGGRK